MRARGLWLALALSLVACGTSPSSAPSPSPSPARSTSTGRARAVLFVVLDGLVDTPAARAATPRVSALATEGSRFVMRTAGRVAPPSVGALLASAPPPLLGLEPEHGTLSPNVWTLADVMRCRDLRSAAFVSNGYLNRESGFARSWSDYLDAMPGWQENATEAVVTGASTWIREAGDARWLVLVNLVEAYAPSERGAVGSSEWLAARSATWSASDAETLDAAQLVRLRRADAALGRLVDAVRAGPYGRNVLVVVTSSGPPVREPPSGARVDFAVPGTDVPLVFAGPGSPPPSSETASALDVAPTILEALGLPLPRSFHGRSLGPAHAEIPEAQRTVPEPYVHGMTRDWCQLVILGYGSTLTEGDCAALTSVADRDQRGYDLLAPTLCP